MELRQLKYFAATAEYLNFSEAADHLCITQGTLSQQIKQLEDELGTPLFIRTSHSVMLSEAGAEMLPLAQKTIEASNECRTKIKDLKNDLCGTLSIGLTASFRDLATNTMRTFLKEYPGVKLDVRFQSAPELLEMLEKREVDVIFAFKPQAKYEEVESEELFDSKLSVIMRKGHPLADRESLTWADLEKQSLALPGVGMQARKAFDRYIDVDTSKLNIHVEMNDPYIIMDMLHGTNLVAMMSSIVTEYDPSLTAVPLEGVDRKMTGCAHWLKGAYRKKSAITFVEMLQESAMIQRIGAA